MKKFSEVIDYYYSELNSIVKELDQKRQKVKQKIIGWTIVLALAVVVLVWGIVSVSDESDPFGTVITLAVLGLGGFGIIYKILTKDYSTEFKLRVIEPLIKFIDHNLTYLPSSTIPQYIFERSKIVTQKIDRYSGDDLVKGVIDDVKIEFCDLHVEKEYEDSKGNSQYQTLFQGIFVRAEFPKHFYARTIVLPDNAEKIFGSYIGKILQSYNFGEEKLVKLDNPEFEKHFVVYSSDQIEARYILSHSMMQRILTFRKKVGHDLSFSFVGGEMFVGVHYNKDSLEASIFGSLLEYKIAKEFVESLYYSLGIVQELQLNQKLWSKR